MVADWVGGPEDGDQLAAWEDSGRQGVWRRMVADRGLTRFIPSLFSLLLP